MQGDGGVEASPAVELHAGPEPVDAGRHRGGESVDGGHRVHPADEQRQPLPGRGVGPHEVRGRGEAEEPGGFADALSRQVVSLARRQVGGAVTDPPDDTVVQQVGRVRWTVACGSPRMPASSVESTNGVRLRASSSCRSEIAKLGSSLLHWVVFAYCFRDICSTTIVAERCASRNALQAIV